MLGRKENNVARNLNRITHYYSKLEAIKDYHKVTAFAEENNRRDLVIKYKIDPEKMGHKKIDRQSAKILNEMGVNGVDVLGVYVQRA